MAIITPQFDGSDYITFQVGQNLYINVSNPLIDDNGNYTNLMNKVLLYGSGEIYDDRYDIRMIDYSSGYRPQVAEYINEGWSHPYLDLGMLGYAGTYSFCDIVIDSGISRIGYKSEDPLGEFYTGSAAEYVQYANYEKWNGKKISEEGCCLFASVDLEYIGSTFSIGSNFPGLKHIQFDAPSKLKEINNIGYYYADNNRQLLETINIPATCKIGGDGFMNCTHLYILNPTNSFGGFLVNSQGFKNCPNLVAFTIPDTASGAATYYAVDTQTPIRTLVRGDTSGIVVQDWTILGRIPVVTDDAIIRIKHLGNIVEIKGYSSGLLPFKHLGNIYYLRECQNGDANQSPLVIKHEGTLHYISK